MTVNELKEILNNLDGNTLVVNKVSVDRGRGSCGGIGSPFVSICEEGQLEREVSDDDHHEELLGNSNWSYDEDQGQFTNTVSMLVIDCSIEEEWYD